MIRDTIDIYNFKKKSVHRINKWKGCHWQLYLNKRSFQKESQRSMYLKNFGISHWKWKWCFNITNLILLRKCTLYGKGLIPNKHSIETTWMDKLQSEKLTQRSAKHHCILHTIKTEINKAKNTSLESNPDSLRFPPSLKRSSPQVTLKVWSKTKVYFCLWNIFKTPQTSFC